MMRLVIVAGPERSGKMPLARRLMADDPSLVLVHRDTIRASLVTAIDEWEVTLIMRDVAARLLTRGRSVIVCAWNLDPGDRALWTALTCEHDITMEWLDVREPEVAAMIPPLAEAA